MWLAVRDLASDDVTAATSTVIIRVTAPGKRGEQKAGNDRRRGAAYAGRLCGGRESDLVMIPLRMAVWQRNLEGHRPPGRLPPHRSGVPRQVRNGSELDRRNIQAP